jgi:hypothetical protein
MRTYLIAVAALASAAAPRVIEVPTINAVGIYLAGEIPQSAISALQDSLAHGAGYAYIGFDTHVRVTIETREIIAPKPVAIPRRDYGALAECSCSAPSPSRPSRR